MQRLEYRVRLEWSKCGARPKGETTHTVITRNRREAKRMMGRFADVALIRAVALECRSPLGSWVEWS